MPACSLTHPPTPKLKIYIYSKVGAYGRINTEKITSLPRPGQNFVSEATLRSVLEIEMGSLGSATADTRSRSFVAERILHFRIIGCFSPTADKTGHDDRFKCKLYYKVINES